MKIHIDGYFNAPTPHKRFDSEIRYFVGFFRGSSIIVSRHYGNIEDATENLSELQFLYPERDYHIFETTIQTLCLV